MIILITIVKKEFVYLRKCSRDCCLPLFCIIIFVMQLEVDNQTLAQKAKEFEEEKNCLVIFVHGSSIFSHSFLNRFCFFAL